MLSSCLANYNTTINKVLMIIQEGLTFGDVLLKPKHSTIKSRSTIDLSVKLGKLTFTNPIIPANMKTITGRDMAQEVMNNGGLAILHRFMSIEDQVNAVKSLIKNESDSMKLAVSIGVKEEDKNNVGLFYSSGIRMICIDIAHGDSDQCVDMIHWLKQQYPDIFIIAGNVATGDGATRLWSAGADVVKVGVGPGCFAAGTRILMSNGFYKNIEDIRKGDYIINKNGKSVKVLDAFSTGIRKVSKLRNNCFYQETYVTPDHKFWIGDLSSNSKFTISSKGYAKILDKKSKTIPRKSKYKWKQISDATNDVCLMPKNIEFNLPDTFKIPLNKKTAGNYKSGYTYEIDSLLSPSYDMGYIIGTFLGDGNASCTENNGSHSGSLKWVFGKNEIEIAKKLIKCINDVFGKLAVITKKENIIEVAFYYKPLADFFNIFDKRENKFLPENLLVNNSKYLEGIYDGLIDSDGCYHKDGRISLSNTSTKVIELFNVIAYKLNGIFPNNSKEKITVGGLKKCKLENCKQPYKSIVLKNGKTRLTKNYQVIKILEYKDIDIEVPVYDITIDCDTHSFIANNMIVHNSLCTTRIETGNGTPQLTALMEVAEAQKDMVKFFKTYAELEGNDNISIKQFPFIADGGITSSGDICKALCFADMVMIGNLFAGCEETPGEVLTIDGKKYKHYVGSSTHKTNHVEGVAAIVSVKGSMNEVLTKLLEGLKSGCSYQNASNLKALKVNPTFIKISNAGLVESYPHDIKVK
jgi:IMP dehydrogenase/GMP reductase